MKRWCEYRHTFIKRKEHLKRNLHLTQNNVCLSIIINFCSICNVGLGEYPQNLHRISDYSIILIELVQTNIQV